MTRLLFKVAKEIKEIEKENKKEKFSAGELMAQYVGTLRGLSIVHQQAHWTCQGDTYYGDHLLFDRLYNSVSDNVDTCAEKLVGVFGAEYLELDSHMESAHKFVKFAMKYKELDERCMAAEKAFLSFSKELYDNLEKMDALTLGLDDLIMSISSEHETNVYLLGQRGKAE